MAKKEKESLNCSDFLGVRSEPITHFLSTGCTILDMAISNRMNGGFPAGRICHIVGSESSAKTMFMAEVLRSSQAQKGTAYLVDSEGTFDFARAKALHDIDIKKLVYLGTQDDEDFTIEYFFDKVVPYAIEGNKKRLPSVIGIDSLSAIPSSIETNEDISKGTYGTSRAKSLSTAFRKYIWKLTDANLSLVFIDQTRQKIGVTFGKKTTWSGGNAIGFYSSTRIETKVKAKIKNKFKKIIGVVVEFEVSKDKVAPPHKKGEIRILFEYGIDDVGTNIVWLRVNDPNYPTKTGYCYPGSDEKFPSYEALVKHIHDEQQEEVLINEVWRVWQEIYAELEYKRRRV